MSNDLIKAADDARRLLRGFKAFAEVADALESVGQLELRAKEATTILAGLQVQVADAQAQVVEAKAAAGRHVDAAKDHAAKLVAKAEVKVSEILGAAETKAFRLVNDTQLVRDQATTHAKMQAQRADEAAAVRDALLKECEALEARLAKAQASVAKLLA